MDIEKQSKYGKNRFDEGRGKGKKALKVIGKIFAGLIALYIVLNIIFGIQLNNTIAELKRQGRPMTIAEIVPAPVPDEENAAILYKKVFALMKGEGKSSVDKLIKISKELKSYSDMSQWTDKQRQEIPKLIYSQELQNIYSLLEEGSRKSKCNFNLDYEKGPATLLLHLNPIRNAMRLLCLKALMEAESEKTAQAFDTLLIGLKTSNHLKDEPILITQLVRIACDGIIIESIKSISDSKGIPVEKANLIMDELSLHKDIEPFVKCMDGERILFGGWVFERILRANPKGLKELDPYNPFSVISVILRKPIYKKDFESYLTFLSKIGDSYNIPYYEYAKDKITGEEIPKYCILTGLILPALNKTRKQTAKHQADIDICRTGLALKIFKLKNMNYPSDLSELVTAGLLKGVPIDSFSGKSLVYSRQIGGFKLYSFGPNMQNDFGTEKTKEKDSPAFENYDLIWQSEI